MVDARGVLELAKNQASLIRSREVVETAKATGEPLLSRDALRAEINRVVNSKRIGSDHLYTGPCPRATWGDIILYELEWEQSHGGFVKKSLMSAYMSVDRPHSELLSNVTLRAGQQERVWALLMETCLVHTEQEDGEVSLCPPYHVVADRFGRGATARPADE